jgi:hypothetical protein
LRQSFPETTAKPGPMPHAPSARPYPSQASAIARCVVTTSRSPTFVVATEQECGKRGMPTTQFSRSFTRTRRKVPALCGMSGSIELKSPVMQLFIAHVRDSFTPAGRQSMLSVRSSSIMPASGSTSIFTLIGMPSGAGPKGSCIPSPTMVPFGICAITWAIRRSE